MKINKQLRLRFVTSSLCLYKVAATNMIEAMEYLYAAKAHGLIPSRPVLISIYDVDHRNVTRSASANGSKRVFEVFIWQTEPFSTQLFFISHSFQ